MVTSLLFLKDYNEVEEGNETVVPNHFCLTGCRSHTFTKGILGFLLASCIVSLMAKI